MYSGVVPATVEGVSIETPPGGRSGGNWVCWGAPDLVLEAPLLSGSAVLRLPPVLLAPPFVVLLAAGCALDPEPEALDPPVGSITLSALLVAAVDIDIR
jgi:hypothetical protein